MLAVCCALEKHFTRCCYQNAAAPSLGNGATVSGARAWSHDIAGTPGPQLQAGKASDQEQSSEFEQRKQESILTMGGLPLRGENLKRFQGIRMGSRWSAPTPCITSMIFEGHGKSCVQTCQRTGQANRQEITLVLQKMEPIRYFMSQPEAP